MAQSNYTPISLYYSTTSGASGVPNAANLVNGELAINITDGKLFYKDNSGVVQTLATKGSGTIGGSDTQVQYNSSGSLAGSANLTFNGTTLTAAGLAGPHNGTVGATTPTTGVFTTAKAIAAATQDSVTLQGRAGGTSSYGVTLTPTTLTASRTLTLPDASGTILQSGTTVTTAQGGTGLISFTSGGVVYASSTSALATGSALTFDGSNLGLGVTPSAWSGINGGAFQFGSGYSSLYSYSNAVTLGSNVYYNAGNKYFASGVGASAYQQLGGVHYWLQTPSGTAGNPITFTQAMTLDASGRLLVGITSSSGSGAQLEVGATTPSIRINATAGGTPSLSLFSSGVYDWIVQGGTALKFVQDATERARIDSSGNLLVGATSLLSNANYFAYSPGNAWGIFGHVNGTASGIDFAKFYYNNTQIGSISQSGTTAVLYNVTSDQRLKENIQDAESASNLIDSLQVRKFDWKSDNTHQRYGFIAQELVTVAPEAVHQPADPEEMMAVDYSKLVPMLVKEIQDLRKRLAAAGI